MRKCTCHPELETPCICMKHQIYLCEEYLACRDPDIYCKFRPSCSTWFMSKRKARLVREEEEKAAAFQAGLRVNFSPDGKSIRVPRGTTLLEAARLADVHINASCNGKGVYGKCKLMVTTGRTENPSNRSSVNTRTVSEWITCLASRIRAGAFVAE